MVIVCRHFSFNEKFDYNNTEHFGIFLLMSNYQGIIRVYRFETSVLGIVLTKNIILALPGRLHRVQLYNYVGISVYPRI